MKKMGVNRKLVEAQIEGLAKAHAWLKEEGDYDKALKRIEEEIKFRNMTYTPVSYREDIILDYLRSMTESILRTTLLLTLTVLRDEFGFGKSRAEKFWKRYTYKTECLRDRAITELSWEDLANQCKEELGFDIDLDWKAWKDFKFMEDEKNGYRNNKERN